MSSNVLKLNYCRSRALARSKYIRVMWMWTSERESLCMINDHWSLVFLYAFCFQLNFLTIAIQSHVKQWWLLVFSLSPLHFTFLSPFFHSFIQSYKQPINSFPKLVCWFKMKTHGTTTSSEKRNSRLRVARFYWKMKKNIQSDWHSFRRHVVRKQVGKNRGTKSSNSVLCVPVVLETQLFLPKNKQKREAKELYFYDVEVVQRDD